MMHEMEEAILRVEAVAAPASEPLARAIAELKEAWHDHILQEKADDAWRDWLGS